MIRSTLTITLLTTTFQAVAQAPDASKSGYSLLNPAPRSLWRPMSADRPDFTESPYTVDAGAMQIEASFFDYARDGDSEAWAVAPTNFKIGLLNNTDIQFVFEPIVHVDDGANTETGLGDTQVRLKFNIWGNDEGDTAFAIMPFIKLPTATNDIGNERVEGGVILPFAVSLDERVGLGFMAEVDAVYNDTNDAYDLDFIGTGVVGVDVTDSVGVYLEGIGIWNTDADTDFRGILGTGATYSLRENTMLDAGFNFGLTGEVDDFGFFTGITWRF